ncbi:hypothetical protein M8J77_018439 [Diaphorina citri]|nr:hypothetical protein M8J77_018439 [Diaphorina citri]
MVGSLHRGDLETPRLQQRRIRDFSQGPSNQSQQPSPSCTPIPPPTVFPVEEQHMPALLLRILLTRAGIETNPGPTWFCTVCKQPILRNVTSVLCNNCNDWCHLKCSTLKSHKDWHRHFVAPCCCVNNQPSNTLPVNLDVEPFSILQFNARGISGKCDEVLDFMHTHNIKLAAIQETKLTARSNLSERFGYTFVRQDRTQDEGGGIAFIIHNTLSYQPKALPNPGTPLEQQAITLYTSNSHITVVNMYIPPRSSCPSGYKADISHLLELEDALILGDINAHHPLWDSRAPADQRGEDITDQIEDSRFGILNEDTPTRLCGNSETSPDITLASDSLIPTTEWKTECTLGSDHLPIIVTLEQTATSQTPSPNNVYINFKKAKWQEFEDYIEDKIIKQDPPRSAIQGEKTLRTIINKACKLFIPAGRIPMVVPNFPSEARRLADERDTLRKDNPSNPRIRDLNQQINKLVIENKRQKWSDYLKEASFKNCHKNLWTTLKSLTKGKSPRHNNPINFNNIPEHNNKKCATKFNKQFNIHPTNYEENKRKINRKFRNYSQLNKQASEEYEITHEDTFKAIKSTKNSKAMGPDGISPIMLKHLGPESMKYLTSILNLSLTSLIIPDIWKVARIIPLPKPNKDVNESNSYRPISLLSPIAKLLELLLLPHINDNTTLEDHQHGFRKNRSTTTALHLVHEQISNGLNQERPCKRTILVALDLTKAFDTISTEILLQDILDSTILPKIKRWLHSYFHGRLTYVEFRNTKSNYRRMKQGVPQGGVISPTLFNLYMSKIPKPPEDLTLVTYADDCTVMATDTNIESMEYKVNSYLETLNNWLLDRRLTLSVEKSTATIFTSWTKEVNTQLDIKVNNLRLPTIKNLKILGVTFDNLLTYNAHAKTIIERVKKRNNAIKLLGGTDWGKEKETIITAYKTIGRSIINYAAPIWTPQLSTTHWKSLQATQNAALRTATGCHLMTNEDHLHNECMVLPIRQHNEMLAQQYLARCRMTPLQRHCPTFPAP